MDQGAAERDVVVGNVRLHQLPHCNFVFFFQFEEDCVGGGGRVVDGGPALCGVGQSGVLVDSCPWDGSAVFHKLVHR